MKKLIDRGSSGEYGWHGLRNWLLCPRLGAFHEQGAEHEPLDYHVRGALGHVGLAHLYKTESMGAEDYLSAEDAVVEYARRHPSDHNDKWVPRVLAMLGAYRARYNGDKQWIVHGVEDVVKIRVTDPDYDEPVTYTARYDMCVERKRLFYYVDHKLTFRIMPKVVDSYRLDGQILGLNLIGRAKYKERWGGVVLNFIQLTGDSIDFKRPALRVPAPVVKDFKNTILEAHRARRRWKDKDPMDVPGVFGEPCMGKYGPCVFRARCGRDVA